MKQAMQKCFLLIPECINSLATVVREHRMQRGGDMPNYRPTAQQIAFEQEVRKRPAASFRQGTEATAPSILDLMQQKIRGNLSLQSEGAIQNQINKRVSNGMQKVTALTQFAPNPLISMPSMAINSALGAKEAYDYHKAGDDENAAISALSALPFRMGTTATVAKVARSKMSMNLALDSYGAAADLTDNFGNTKKQQGGSMNPYDFLFGDDEEEDAGAQVEPTPDTLQNDTDAKRALSEQRRLSDEEENDYALQIAMEQFPELRRGNPYAGQSDEEEGGRSCRIVQLLLHPLPIWERKM
jgi:hypothetical protein